MPSNDDVKIRITGDPSDLDQATKEAEGFLGRLTGGAKGVSSGMAALLGGVGGVVASLAKDAAGKLFDFFQTSITEAGKAEQSNARLGQALQNLRINYDSVRPSIDNMIEGLTDTTTFADDDLRDAFTNMVQLTGDAKGSLESLAVVADLAAAKNIDLSQASDIVGKAMAGNTTQLTRLFPSLKGSTDAVGDLGKMLSGTAAAQANTFGGALQQAQRELGELKESTGRAAEGSGFLTQATKAVAAAFTNAGKFLDENKAKFAVVADAIGVVVSAVWDLIKAIGGPLLELLGPVLKVDLGIALGLFQTLGFAIKELATGIQYVMGWVLQGVGVLAEKAGGLLKKIGIDIVAESGTSMRQYGEQLVASTKANAVAALDHYKDAVGKLLDGQITSNAKSEAEDARHTEQLTGGARTRTTKITAEEKKLNEALANAGDARREADLKNLTMIAAAGAKLRADMGKDAQKTQADLLSLGSELEKVVGPLQLEMAQRVDNAIAALVKKSGELVTQKTLAGTLTERDVQNHQRLLTLQGQIKTQLVEMLPGAQQSADLAKYAADLEAERAKSASESAAQHDKLRQQIVAAARGAVELADAFGIVNDQSAKVLNDVINIAEALPGALKGDIGSIVQVVGSLANVIAGIGGSQAEQVRLAASQKNTAALDKLTREVGNLDLDASGNVFDAAQKATKAAQDAYEKAVLAGSDTKGIAAAMKTAFDVSLAKSGVSFTDANALFKSLSGHDLARANAQGSISDLAAFSDQLQRSEFGQFGQDFKGQQAFTEASIDINKLDTFGQFGAYAKLFSQFSSGLGGILDDRTRFNTAEGRAGLLGQVQGLLGQLNAGTLDPTEFGKLNGNQFLDALKTLTGLINSAGDQVGHLTNPDTPVGADGTTATDTGGQVPTVEVPTLDESIEAQTDVFSAGFGETNDWLAKIAANTASSMTSLVDSTRASLPGSNPRADAERAAAMARTINVGPTNIHVTVSGADDPRTVAAAVIEQIDRGMADRYDDVRAASGSAVLP